jgi:hypothetical protein
MRKIIKLTELDLTRIVKRVISEGKKKEDNDLFIAKDGDNELIVSEKMLQPSKVRTLLNKLNKSGFNLGSGHEEIEIIKRNDGSYVFRGVTYYGAPTQSVDFERVK